MLFVPESSPEMTRSYSKKQSKYGSCDDATVACLVGEAETPSPTGFNRPASANQEYKAQADVIGCRHARSAMIGSN